MVTFRSKIPSNRFNYPYGKGRPVGEKKIKNNMTTISISSNVHAMLVSVINELQIHTNEKISMNDAVLYTLRSEIKE